MQDLWLQTVDQASFEWALQRVSILDDDEVGRWRRYLSSETQALYLVAHVATRCVLSQYDDRDPPQWRFGYGDDGRPELVGGPSGLRFNLSHTEGMVSVLVHDKADAGVDVENTSQSVDMASVARRVFTEHEQAALFALAPLDQIDRFYQLWTLKEAFIKAKGKGFALPLKQFGFSIGGDQPIEFACDRSIEREPKRWQFSTHRPTAQHIVSVALDRTAGDTETPVVIRSEDVTQCYQP